MGDKKLGNSTCQMTSSAQNLRKYKLIYMDRKAAVRSGDKKSSTGGQKDPKI